MKSWISLFLIFISSFSFAQSFSGSPAFWNTISMDNPALSALDNYADGNINFNKYNDIDIYRGSVLYHQKVTDLHGAIGINAVFNEFESVFSNRTMLNYNYQIPINANHLIAVGAGVGFLYERYPDNFYEFDNPMNNQLTEFLDVGSIGMAYRSRLVLVGVSISKIDIVNSERNDHDITIFGEFRQQIGKKILLTPKVMYLRRKTPIFNTEAINIALVGEFNTRFTFGIGINDFEHPFFTGGIHLNPNWVLEYTYLYEPGNSFDYSKHDVNLRYTLQHKKVVRNQ